MDHPILFTIVSAFFLFAFYLTITGQQNRPLLIVSKEEIVIWPSFEPIIELNISDYFLIDRSDYLFKNRMSMTIKKYDIKNNQDTTFHLTIIDLYDKVYEYDSKSFHKLDNTVLFAIESFANLKNACLIRKGEWLSIEDRMEMPSFEVKPISDYFLINAEDYLQKKGMLNIIWWAFINSNRDNTYTLTITDEWGQQYEVVSDVFDAITIELMTEIRRFDNLKDKRFERVGEYLRIIGD